MSYDLTVQQKEGYLHFSILGQNTMENVRDYLADIAKICVIKGCSSVLVEEYLSGPSLSIFDIFKVTEEAARNTPSLIRRIAYIDKNPEHSQSDMKFAETVAVNRGLNVRIFETIESAEAWLQSFGSGTSSSASSNSVEA